MNSKYVAHLFSVFFLSLLSLFFIAQQCENTSSETPRSAPLPANMMERVMMVTSVDAVNSEEEQTVVQISFEAPDPCWKYSRHETSPHNGATLVKVYALRNTDEQCIQKICSLPATLAFGAEVVSLRFWQSDAATLDTLINR